MTSSTNSRSLCREHLERFFASYHDPTMQKSAMKALRFLTACDGSLSGKPEGWAAGIVYFIANRGGRPCGVPGLLNADFAQFFGVSMSVIRRRAAQVERALDI